MERKRVAEATKGVGRPKVGGPFELVDHNGKVFTDADMKGRYSLVRPYPSWLGYTSLKWDGRRANDGGIGIFRILPLPRHLPRRTRQNGPNPRPPYHLPPHQAPPPNLHNLRPSPRHARRSRHLFIRIPPLNNRSNRNLGADKRRV